MSTKTIAVDTALYEKLVTLKKGDEPLSKVIERLAGPSAAGHTGAAILSSLRKAPKALTNSEAAKMTAVVDAHRKRENWPTHDLS